MNITRHSPAQATQWFKQAISDFRRKPMPLLMYAVTHLLFTNMLVIMLMSIPVFISLPLFFISFPIGCYLSFNASRLSCSPNKEIAFAVFSPLSNAKLILQLSKLAILPALGMSIFILITQLFFTEELTQAAQMLNKGTLEVEDLQNILAILWIPVLIFVLIYYFLILVTYYSSILIGQTNTSVRKSLFFAWIAIAQNKLALFVLVLYAIGLAFSTQAILGLLLGAGIPSAILSFVSMPLSLVVLSVISCSFFHSFNAIFLEQIQFSDT